MNLVKFPRYFQIAYYNDELQGQCSAGFSSLMFDGTVDGSLEPRTSDATFTLTDSDRDRVYCMTTYIFCYHFLHVRQDIRHAQLSILLSYFTNFITNNLIICNEI